MCSANSRFDRFLSGKWLRATAAPTKPVSQRRADKGVCLSHCVSDGCVPLSVSVYVSHASVVLFKCKCCNDLAIDPFNPEFDAA